MVDLSSHWSATAAGKESRDSHRSPAQGRALHLIQDKHLVRECVGRWLTTEFHQQVVAFDHVEQWVSEAASHPPSLIFLSVFKTCDVKTMQRQLDRLAHRSPSAPVVVFSEHDDLQHLRAAIAGGARGYVPMNIGLDDAVQAIRFVLAGGTFVPASSLASIQRSAQVQDFSTAGSRNGLTKRQAAVVDALRRGKANKMIAHELNLTESTVKVHVRNIMKKLNAKNRTEVAFIAQSWSER
jgi:DNA-binding NarL/FixJ family response regulator